MTQAEQLEHDIERLREAYAEGHKAGIAKCAVHLSDMLRAIERLHDGEQIGDELYAFSLQAVKTVADRVLAEQAKEAAKR